ncbi:MAG TPA: tRNA pseudouridine(54/55) synthase Pus10 [Methanoregulaceae archaeon]|nr:MAG: tRNA pseudouridine(54/55) synthase Pus10 [Methanolinea sp.]HON81899.1 tRNA pseudouridine(54/55) synthase Pus10 [Methanoregulaceae archaeon]HPD10703.1 tRNA pseudouridine(54/55) synthase Pus10 [Methanoregulaceae archaeon]HRT15832.1 tRNA pseudouridine(54/55) synthase Pus10 [Methanoregulaceae archaeon]HRU31346.1 tRNA pseudouridine(54/55) synthase Pus10 [Methanoregulaceae archaeon]
MDLTELTGAILAYGEICDHCLGRMFGKRSFSLTNDNRGVALRITYFIARNEPYTPHEGTCWICQGFFEEIGVWADRVVTAINDTEFSTFLIGTRIPPLMAEAEEMVWSDLSLTHAEPIKSEINREVGKAVALRTGKEADLLHPDVVAILDPLSGTVEVQVKPVFFSGRYRKLERGIPQTHWDCRVCRGNGCERCGFTGKQYPDSVEELMGRPVIDLFKAEGAVLHGAGREDIDARMIGTGRPFVMEVVTPRTRTVDLRTVEQAINTQAAGRVEVSLTGWSRREDVETIKSDKAYKKYRILVEIDGLLSLSELKSAVASLKGVTIEQRTPQRVSHRRADKIRERKVLDIEAVGEGKDGFVIEVTGEAGLYIKELISGDSGRTRPSLAGVLNRPARVTELDVIAVRGSEEE